MPDAPFPPRRARGGLARRERARRERARGHVRGRFRDRGRAIQERSPKRGRFRDRGRAAGERARIRVSVHPLFWVLAAWFLWRGEGLLFFTVTAAALLHECGHAFYAARIGCRLCRLLLTPCGAVVRGDIAGISLKDEVLLALAGPAVNAACACLFAGLWWFFPAAYAYTDAAFYASAGLCLANLLPAWPLDGGRVLYCAAARLRGEPFARRLALAVTLALAAAALALFAALAAGGAWNVSLLLFALFLVCGCFGGQDCRYERLRLDPAPRLARGMEVRRVALSQACSVKKALSFLERGRWLELDLFTPQGEYVCTLTQSEFLEILQRADIYRPLSEYIG